MSLLKKLFDVELKTICSITLNEMLVNEMKQYFLGRDLSPFLKMGVTTALFQSSGRHGES